MKYGIGYKGSKNKLAEQILALFPKRENFYDLFCGGGAITHAALLQDNFKHYFMNDINPLVTQVFIDAARGKYHNEKRWITREQFNENKENDGYISTCWSFGNNMRDYLYGRDCEEIKKVWHNAIYNGDYKGAKDLLNIDFSPLENIKTIQEKYSISKQIINKSKINENVRLEHLEHLQNLSNLERLERLERLEIMNNSFEMSTIQENSVIYCDIPYENTNAYGAEKDNLGFNFNLFYDWAESQKELCFISSYDMPRNRFEPIAEFKHRSTLSATANNEVTERVFIPKHQIEIYKAEQPQPSLFSDLW